MDDDDVPLLEYWYRAQASKWGVAIATNLPDELRSKLYYERQKSDEPSLQDMTIVIPKTRTEVWIVHKKGAYDGQG